MLWNIQNALSGGNEGYSQQCADEMVLIFVIDVSGDNQLIMVNCSLSPITVSR